MAKEASTNELLKEAKETNKKITIIGNILNKNMVPASQQKERDAEANAWKGKLFGFLSGISDRLDELKKPVTIAKIPFALILGVIGFLIGFFTEIARQLGKLKAVLTGIKNLPQLIAGFFNAIRGGLVAAREAVVAKIAGAVAAFKESKAFKLIASGLDDLRDAYRIAREGVVLRIQNALAAFKEHKAVKAVAGAFTRLRLLLNAGKLHVIELLKSALAAFKENAVVKAIGGAFTRMRNLLNLGKLHVIELFKAALAAFKENAVVKAIGGAFGRMRMLLNAGKLHVIELFKAALAAFKENSVVKAIGGAFTRMRMLLNAAKGFVIGLLTTSLAAFKENAVVKALGGVFKTIAGIFGSAVGIAEGGGAATKGGGIIGSLRAGMAAFRESAVFKAFSGIGKIIAGVFAGVLSLVGGAAKAATGPIAGMGAKAGTGIVGAVSSVTKSMGGMIKAIANFPGFKGIVTFAKGFGSMIGKLLWPITIIIGIFDFIKGFRKDEGWDGEPATIFDKIGMGISEALQGLIGLPLDMIKNGIAWILKKFGIGTTTDPETGEEMESQWMTTMKAFSFSDLIDKLIASIWAGLEAVIDWFKLLFTDPVGAIVKLAVGYVNFLKGIGSWIYSVTFKPLVDWIMGIFGWNEDDPELKKKKEEFSFLGIIGDALTGIWNWFKDLLDIDWKGVMDKLVPDWAKKILPGFGGEVDPKERDRHRAALVKYEEEKAANKKPQKATIQAADQARRFLREEAADKDLVNFDMAGASEIDQKAMTEAAAAGQITREAVQALLHYDDWSKKTKADETHSDQVFLEKLLEGLKPLEAGKVEGSFYVHDVHVEKAIKEMIQPMINLANAQNALLQAYGNGGGSGGGTTVNNVTVAPSTVNSSSSATITETSYGVADPYTSAAGAYG